MTAHTRNWCRILIAGGFVSFRALFNWMTPWIYIPNLVVAPVLQILLFAYVGRSAAIEADQFYVIGNAIQFSVIPCLFAMGATVSGERYTQTLGLVLSSPAPRIPLFLGRALPVIVNGWVSSMLAVILGGTILGATFGFDVLSGMALAIAAASLSCAGLGLMLAAIDLRVREGAVLNNIVFGFLLIFTGANVASSSMPDWMAGLGQALPLTHSIEAARRLADGADLGSVVGALGVEVLIGGVYMIAGLLLLRWLETSSRRHASLEIM